MSIVAYTTEACTGGCVLLCEMCVYVADFFTVRVQLFVPGHVPLSRLCTGPYIPVASRQIPNDAKVSCERVKYTCSFICRLYTQPHKCHL